MTSDSDSDDDDNDNEVGAQALCNGHCKVISSALFLYTCGSPQWSPQWSNVLHMNQDYFSQVSECFETLTFKAKNSH